MKMWAGLAIGISLISITCSIVIGINFNNNLNIIDKQTTENKLQIAQINQQMVKIGNIIINNNPSLADRIADVTEVPDNVEGYIIAGIFSDKKTSEYSLNFRVTYVAYTDGQHPKSVKKFSSGTELELVKSDLKLHQGPPGTEDFETTIGILRKGSIVTMIDDGKCHMERVKTAKCDTNCQYWIKIRVLKNKVQKID